MIFSVDGRKDGCYNTRMGIVLELSTNRFSVLSAGYGMNNWQFLGGITDVKGVKGTKGTKGE